MAPYRPLPQFPFGLKVFKVEGFYHTLFLEANGTLRYWYNSNGPWDNHHRSDQSDHGDGFQCVQFAAGSEHTLIVKTDGTLWGIEERFRTAGDGPPPAGPHPADL